MNISYWPAYLDVEALERVEESKARFFSHIKNDDRFAFPGQDAKELALAGRNGKAWAGNAKTVYLIGLGGSRYGVEALFGGERSFDSAHLVCVDSLDELLCDEIKYRLEHDDPSDFVVVVVSKSGDTLETSVLANEIVFNAPYFSRIKDRVLVETEKGSSLANKAEGLGLRIEYMSSDVGGRFSVFTPATFFVLGALSLDTDIIAQRYSLAESEFTCGELSPLIRAEVLMSKEFEKIYIHDIMAEAERFVPLSYWTRQLWAESLGKVQTYNLLPTVSPLTRDCHSVLQMYFGSKPSRAVSFVVSEHDTDMSIGRASFAISEAVIQAHKDHAIPHFVHAIEVVGNGDTATYMYREIVSVLYTAWTKGIDPFGQPDIEEYKKHAKEIFNKNTN